MRLAAIRLTVPHATCSGCGIPRRGGDMIFRDEAASATYCTVKCAEAQAARVAALAREGD